MLDKKVSLEYLAIRFKEMFPERLESRNWGFGCTLNRTGKYVEFNVRNYRCKVSFIVFQKKVFKKVVPRYCGEVDLKNVSAVYELGIEKKGVEDGMKYFIDSFVIPLFAERDPESKIRKKAYSKR